MFGFHCLPRETDGHAGVQPAGPINCAGAGAGANACQDPQMVLFANSPLSELVWSQAEGLGVKYASSEGLVEKKTPLFWNTETFNVISDSPFNGVCFLSEGRKMENFKSVSDLGPRGLVTRHERDSNHTLTTTKYDLPLK